MSPSRLMAIMDPLLNTGFLWRSLSAYAGIKDDQIESVAKTTNTKENPSSQIVSDSNKKTKFLRGNPYYTQLGFMINKIIQLKSCRNMIIIHSRRYYGL